MTAGIVTPPARPAAVVFDCDGVLVDSEPITNGVLTEMLNELGIDFDVATTMRTFMGKSVKDEIGWIERRIGRPLAPDWHPQFVRRRDAALAARVEAIDGVAAVIERLAALGIPFAVASGADTAKMKITLGRARLLPYFQDRMFGSDMVARSKPAPDVYLMAMQHLGVGAARTIVVEDTPTGTRAGVAAGATVYGFATVMEPGLLAAAGAIRCFARMAELPPLLGLTAAR
ncbi:MAG: HAD family hydrolase [Lautropia sp.]